MNINAVADAVLAELSPLHARTHRNKPPQSPVWPYVIYRIDSVTATDPSADLYLNIDIFDDPNASVRAMETLADTIQNDLDNKVLLTSLLNLHFAIEQRQYVSNTDLVTAQMINLRFVVRAYFK